jgi:hypothetical protein
MAMWNDVTACNQRRSQSKGFVPRHKGCDFPVLTGQKFGVTRITVTSRPKGVEAFTAKSDSNCERSFPVSVNRLPRTRDIHLFIWPVLTGATA